MTPFEYLAVLISIVPGLGVTELLSGRAGPALSRRRDGRLAALFLAAFVVVEMLRIA